MPQDGTVYCLHGVPPTLAHRLIVRVSGELNGERVMTAAAQESQDAAAAAPQIPRQTLPVFPTGTPIRRQCAPRQP